MMTVEVAYATPEKQMIVPVELSEPKTAYDVVVQSEIVKHFPEIKLDALKLGIFSKKISGDYMVRDKDRIEIYRPLTLNAREKRFKRLLE